MEDLFNDNSNRFSEEIKEAINGDPYRSMIINNLIIESYDHLMETHNFHPRKTGYNHCLEISDNEGMRHGPRVKIGKTCRDTRYSSKSDIISFSEKRDASFITDGKNADINNKDKKLYLLFVNLNKEILLEYWYNALDMIDEERAELLSKIKYPSLKDIKE